MKITAPGKLYSYTFMFGHSSIWVGMLLCFLRPQNGNQSWKQLKFYKLFYWWYNNIFLIPSQAKTTLVNSTVNLILEDCLSKHTEKVMFSLRICKRINMKEDKIRISSSITNLKWLSYCSIFSDFFSTVPTVMSPAPFPHTIYSLQNQIVFQEFLLQSSFLLLDKLHEWVWGPETISPR